MAVEIENLCKSFGDKKVLHNLNMRLEDGGIYCLMGPSGMGKTTLLRIIMNLETKDSGNIIGIDPETEISAMFQEDRILPYLSAAENVNMMYEKKRPLKEIKQDLELILPKKCLNQPVCELSGGMKRRVSLARTMHFQGKMIILDEPFTGLDTETRQKVIQYILRNRGNRILLVATHGENDAALLGAEIIRLEKCQDLQVLHGREHEKKEIQREKIQQVEELLKSCSAEQLENICQFIQKVQDNGGKDRIQADMADRLFANWKTPIMNRIPQEEWSRVLSMLPGEKKYYKSGEILWNTGDTITVLPVLLKGSVAAYTVNGKGQESEIGKFAEGNCFGEMLAVQKIPSPVVVKALEESEVMYLSMECLVSKGYDNENGLANLLLWEIIYNMADKIGIVTDKLSLMSGTMDEKILAYLKKMPESEDGCRILDRTLTELAQYFQIPKQSLSRKLADMEEKGLIRKESMRKIQILRKKDEDQERKNRGKEDVQFRN